MSDDESDRPDGGRTDGPGEPEETKPDLSVLRRRQAEGTAADLARMGIDPRSLGLSGAGQQDVPAEAPAVEQDPGPSASVVPLRPGVEVPAPAEPLLPPGGTAPSPGAGQTVPAPTDDSSNRAPTVVERLLSRTAGTARAPRQTGRLVRTITKGITTADAADSVLADREVVDAVRQRQSDRRVVALVAGKGGVGCTSTAVGLAATFMALREDRSAVVDVQQGTTPLSLLFGAQHSLDLAAASTLEAEAPVPTAAAGFGVVDAVEWDLRPGRRDLAGAIDRLGVDHTFTVLDAGSSASEAAHAGLARADQVVVVTTAGGLGLAALQAAVDRVRDVNPAAAGSIVHVVVCPHEESYRTVHREVVGQLGERPAALVVVPPDPVLALGDPYDPAKVAAATREAYVRLAAAVALGATR